MPEPLSPIKDVVTGKTIIKNPLDRTKISKRQLEEILNCENMNPSDM